MAELVGVFAASHAPPLYRNWSALSEERRTDFENGYARLASRIADARPDLFVVIGADHFNNFFLNHFPSFCIGLGAVHGAPPEPWLKDHAEDSIVGNAPFALHLMRHMMREGFDPSFSHSLALDHSFFLPFYHAGITNRPPIVPIVVNAIEEPLSTFERCRAWGFELARAIAAWPGTERVAIMASGGLSHIVGSAHMGRIDEEFDLAFLEALATGDAQAIINVARNGVKRAGNGAEEVRYWIMAHAAAGERGFEQLHYCPEPAAYVGCAIASWHLTQGGTGR